MNQADLQKFGIHLDANTCEKPWEYSGEMLKRVSRTFALNIAVLPLRLRRHVLLAYIFCRIADTIEDDPLLDGKTKSSLLKRFANIFSVAQGSPESVQDFVSSLPAHWQGTEDQEHFLCLHAHWPIALWKELPSGARQPIGHTVIEMCQGMGEFALAKDAAGGWYNPNDVAELDRYCYYVAGIVGDLLCDLFKEHCPHITESTYKRMCELSVSVGLGLQVTNIVKDVSDDVERGVSFLPLELAKRHGAQSVKELYGPQGKAAGAAVVRDLSVKALRHLEDALRYSLLIPWRAPRIRLFCLWPLFMATLSLIAVGKGEASFQAGKKPKITRKQVKSVLRSTTLLVWCPPLLRHWFEKHARQIRQIAGSGMRVEN